MNPSLSLLDEPTGGLDPLMQQRFFDLLEQENKKGATVLLSSHILSEVQRLCDRIAIIKEGRIIKVEKISTLREDNFKRFRLETRSRVREDLFKLDGVNNLQITESGVSFLFKGDVNAVVRRIAETDIRNIWVEDPDLEEIFIHYYESEA